MSPSTTHTLALPLARIAHDPQCPSPIMIRPLSAGDVATVQAVFDGLGAESRFLRFHTGIPRLTPGMLTRLAAVSDDEHVVFVAHLHNRAVGLVRWIRLSTEPTVADIALEVIDDAQRRGVGTALLAVAARSASRAGIVEFHADVVLDHRRLRRWFGRLGIEAAKDDLTRFRLPVRLALPG